MFIITTVCFYFENMFILSYETFYSISVVLSNGLSEFYYKVCRNTFINSILKCTTEFKKIVQKNKKLLKIHHKMELE